MPKGQREILRHPILEAPPRQTFRCLQGQGGLRSRYLHFDSYLLTIIAPVAIPTLGPLGELVLVRRRRPIRRGYLFNVLEKAVLDRSFVQRLLWWLIDRKRLTITRVELVPGSLYIFLGYQTLHTNEPCAPDQLRATAIFHYAPVHAQSITRRWLDRLRGA